MLKLNYLTLYRTFINLQDSDNDLDVLEDLSENLEAFEDVVNANAFEAYGMVSDDTTQAHMEMARSETRKLVSLATPLVENFLGISERDRKEISRIIPRLLVSYGIILYKTYGYEVIADQYSMNNSIDISQLTLTPELLDQVAKDMPTVIETINTILASFKMFGAYFAEYQIGDSQELYDVIAQLEEQDFSADQIGRLSEAEVQKILAEAGY